MSDRYFGQLRNVELSTIYYLQNQINADWSNISVIKAKKNAPAINPPFVTVKAISVFPKLKEIGSRLLDNTYNIIVDIYASSDGQKLDLAQFLEDKIILDWTYYIHSQASGTPEVLVRSDSGKLKWQNFTQHTSLDFVDAVDKPDRFRYVLAFNVKVATNA